MAFRRSSQEETRDNDTPDPLAEDTGPNELANQQEQPSRMDNNSHISNEQELPSTQLPKRRRIDVENVAVNVDEQPLHPYQLTHRSLGRNQRQQVASGPAGTTRNRYSSSTSSQLVRHPRLNEPITGSTSASRGSDALRRNTRTLRGLFGYSSPFYEGPTTFGGNSANSRIFQGNEDTLSTRQMDISRRLQLSNGSRIIGSSRASEANRTGPSLTCQRILQLLEDKGKQSSQRNRAPPGTPYALPSRTTTDSTMNNVSSIDFHPTVELLNGRRRIQKVTQASRNLLHNPAVNQQLTRPMQDSATFEAGFDQQHLHTNKMRSRFYRRNRNSCSDKDSSPPMTSPPNLRLPTPNPASASQGPGRDLNKCRIFTSDPSIPLPPPPVETTKRTFNFVPPIELEEDYINTTAPSVVAGDKDVKHDPASDETSQQLLTDPQSNKWLCDICTAMNEMTRLRCLCCDNLKLVLREAILSSDSDESA